MPLQSTSGAASYDAFGGGAAAKVNYIEDFFQSYLRTGTGASATVTTGLDGSTKETLVWTKSRSAATNHKLTDNVRGATKALSSNTTGAEATDSQGLTAFSATGYTIGTNTDYNNSGATYVDWQWVAQPKFFDIVTFTTTGSNPNTGNISHNLGSTPACVMVKSTSGAQDWKVYHIGTEGGGFFAINRVLQLNDTTAAQTSTNWINVSSTTISFPGGALDSGVDFVAYLFASNAGGFGLTGTDNVISCGSFTTDGAGDATVNLGYEPQWFLRKETSSANDWVIFDNMRGWSLSDDAFLYPNSSSAELSANRGNPTATGFTLTGQNASAGFIYIAIRRGPMKVPTVGTSVFAPITYAGTNTAGQVISGANFPPDLSIPFSRAGAGGAVSQFIDRLRGGTAYLPPSSTAAEGNSAGYYIRSFNMDGVTYGTAYLDYTNSAYNYVNWMFRRAPSFFDEVCYAGTGSVGNAISHNLGVAPELAIFKGRAGTVGSSNWSVFTQFASTNYVRAFLQLTDVGTTFLYTNNAGIAAAPTSTTITVDNVANLNNGATTYVAYLFATCAGVSKVGSYTGNGSTQTIDCGFTGGARFVMVKATSTTGNWIVADSARGIVAGNDPALYLNSTAAEVTGLDWIDADNSGFVVNETATIAANTNGVSYIFLSIA